MADDIKATPPKNKGALGVAKAVQKAHEFLSKPFGYQNPPGELLSELVGLPSVVQTLERIGYGEPLTTGAGGLGGTSRPRPEVIEAAMAIAPLAQMTKGMPVGMVIKPKGGNWLTGSVEKAVKPLKGAINTAEGREELRQLREQVGDLPRYRRAEQEYKNQDALDNWIDRNLTNYIKKEMATPEDPVRKLAEKGIVHIPSDQVGINRYKAPYKRSLYDGEQLGQSEAAKAWEDASDVAINAPFAQQMVYGNMLEKNPWLSKLDPQERVYALNTPASGNQEISGLGFDHIIDVLREDLATGRIRPEQLNKVSMEQAVRRTFEYDQEMAKKMREAQIKATEGMPVHKEYPEGFKWVELKPNKNLEGVDDGFGNVSSPGYEELEKALKYEGDTMGHCVGGYCDDVYEGRSRIYSLRDAKGEPHVTVEVKPHHKQYSDDDEVVSRFWQTHGRDPVSREELQQFEGLKPRITQIKGKQNRAPKEEYLPYVQDFVRGGQWSDVGDIQNTGLIKHETGKYISKQEMDALARKHFGESMGNKPDDIESADAYYKRISRYNPELLSDIDKAFIEDWKAGNFPSPDQGMKRGGVVISDNPDTMLLELQDKKYQFGGLVRRGADAAKKGIPFFSKVDEVAKELPRTKGTGAEFMKELEKTKGVKPAEIQHRKLDEIKAMPKMTKEQFIGELEKRPPAQLEEKVLGGQQEFDAKRLAQLEKEYRGLKQHPIDDPSFGEEKYNELIRLMNIRDQSTVNTLYDAAEQATRSAQRAQQQGNRLTAEKYFREAEFLNTRAEKLDLQGQGQANPPKFDRPDLILPGGKNYREILLKLTNKPQPLPEGFEVNAYSVNGKTKYGVFDEKGQRYGSGDTKDEALQRFSNLHQQKPYESSHWQGEPNVIAHARVSDRIGPNGEKVLHVEEIQSDWHQAGRRARDKEVKRLMEEKGISKKEASALVPENFGYGPRIEKTVEAYYETKDGQRIPIGFGKTKEEAEASIDIGWKNLVDIKYETLERKVGEGVPDAPFKKNWHELMMNRILADAAEKGYDRVALSPGAIQAERYKLSSHIDNMMIGEEYKGNRQISWKPKDSRAEQALMFDKNGNVTQSMVGGLEGKNIADVFGKDLAEKIMQSKPYERIEGVGLDIGGEGMQGFYDKMLPDYLNSLGKKYGVEVEPLGVNIHSNLEGFMPKDQMELKTLHGLKITPEMRQEFTEKGFPMYSIAAPVGLGATQIEAPQAPQPVQISDNPDAMMMQMGDREFQVGGAVRKGLKAVVNATKEAPMIVVPSNISNVKEAVRQSKGDYGARRVERAADEIPNLEKLYKEEALRQAFSGENNKAVVTMNPADFEKYAHSLAGRTRSDIGPKMAKLAEQGEIDKYTVPTEEYIQHLMRLQGGFDDIPYLNLYKNEVGIPSMPEIRGHEGRHRSRALAKQGANTSLVRISPRGDLYEGLPRRSQEEYIEALREELERSGRLVLPEIEDSSRRPAVKFPEPYAEGGKVDKADNGLIRVKNKRKAKA